MSAVKGTAIESVVADVKRLVEEGRIAREQLEIRLPAEDLGLLDQKIIPALWYPIGAYGRLMELLFEVEGRRSHEYLVERGRRAADRIRATGLYAQLSGDRGGWGDRIGKILVSLGPAMYKDTQWSFELPTDGGRTRFQISVVVAAEFPDVCRWPTQGFIDYMATMYAPGVRISSERISPTLITFSGEAA